MPDFDFEFDFERWHALAQDDPKRFFSERERIITDFIASQPSEAQSGLRDLQERIDGLRASAGSPLLASRQLAQLLEDHLGALAGQLRRLQQETDSLHATLLQGRRGGGPAS